MADRPVRDKPKLPPARRATGFLRAGGLIEAQMRTAAARRGFALARLAALWPEIVGPALAAACHPAKLATPRGPAGGLLTLAVAPAHGPEVQVQTPVIRERVNAALGPGTVGRILLVPARAPLPAPLPAPRPRPAPAADLGRLAGPVSTIGDDDLRQALETLARNVLSRTTTHPEPERSP